MILLNFLEFHKIFLLQNFTVISAEMLYEILANVWVKFFDKHQASKIDDDVAEIVYL